MYIASLHLWNDIKVFLEFYSCEKQKILHCHKRYVYNKMNKRKAARLVFIIITKIDYNLNINAKLDD